MSSKKQLLMQYGVLYKWFRNALVDFKDEETNQRVNENMNHVKWLAGHIVNGQYAYALIAGVKTERKWDDLFAGLGKTKALDNYPYPDIEEIKAESEHIQQLVTDKLEELTEDELGKELQGTPLGNIKVIDFWSFMNIHQCYHIGQLGILRRGLGKDPMSLR